MEIDKCKGLLNGFKAEKDEGSSLLKETAKDAQAIWTWLTAILKLLEENVARYNNLALLICTSTESEAATQIKVDQSFIPLEGYVTRVAEVKTSNITIFCEIEDIVNPPSVPAPDNPRPGQSTQQVQMAFKPQTLYKHSTII